MKNKQSRIISRYSHIIITASNSPRDNVIILVYYIEKTAYSLSNVV